MADECVDLVEREEELATVQAAVEAAREGLGRLVVVSGEAGAGKTALLRSAARQIRSGVAVLDSRSDDLMTASPLGVLHEIATHLGLNSADIDLATSQASLFSSVLSALIDRSPLLWIVDDIHWADGASLDLLRYISRRIDRLSIVLAVTFRSDEVSDQHPAHALVAEMMRSPVTARIELEPLSESAVGEIVGLQRCSEVLRLTNGNPFFVTELADLDSKNDTAKSVRDVVLGRLNGLDPDQRGVVDLAAVGPRGLPFAAAREILGSSDDVLADVTRTGVLTDSPNGLSFRHEISRRAVEGSLSVARRQTLNAQMLSYWQANDADESLLAHHAVETGDGVSIARFVPRAARQARQSGAYREAVAYADAALGCEQLDQQDRIGLLVTAALVLPQVGEFQEALTRADELLALASHTDDQALLAMAWHTASNVRYHDSAEAAREAVNRAVEAAETCGDADLLAKCLVDRAFFAMFARRYAAPLADLNRADALLEERDVAMTTRILGARGCVEVVGGNVDEGLRLLEESLAMARAHGDDHHVLVALGNLGSAAGESRRYPEALHWLTMNLQEPEAFGDFKFEYSRAWLLRVLVEMGRWNDADKLLSEELPLDNPASIGTREGAIARLRVRRGEAEAVSHASASLEVVANRDLQQRWPLACAIAEHAWLVGDEEVGLATLANVVAEAFESDSAWARGETAFWFVRCGGSVADQIGGAGPDTPFHLHLAGQWREAADAWQKIGCPYEQALALADGAEGDLLDAIAIFDELGARPAASWARRRLRSLGTVTVPRGKHASTRANRFGLTRRQAEVLDLATEGLTNPEIAKRLFVSAKTVEHHMSAVLMKLGAKNRREAIRHVLANGETPSDG